MSDAAVSVNGIGKRYRLGHTQERYARLTESLWNGIRHPIRRSSPEDDLWALRNVSFDVQRGDVVGIIGRNGAGKSTLLKILSRIVEPTEGEAILRGRIASLLEVGTGFHPELTGRENIYLSGSILGMRRVEIQQRFDEIVAFAELERFLDTPVKRYSSGMQVRLGFAVAAHLEPEILIIDEVLAVGDAAFQKKSLAKMEDVAHGGRTVLFVSHNMAAVDSLCTTGVVLEQGSAIFQGSARDAVEHYLSAVSQPISTHLSDRMDRQGTGRMRFVALDASLRTGSDSEFRIAYEGAEELENVEFSIAMSTTRGEGAANLWTAAAGQTFDSLPPRGEVVCRIPRLPLMPGNYSVNILCTVNGVIADWVQEASVVEVLEGDYFGSGRLPPTGYGNVIVDHEWLAQRG